MVVVFLLGIVSAWSATVSTIEVPSAVMKKDIPVTVILPDALQKEGTRLPVLYLLNGHGGDNASWATYIPIQELSEQYGVIVV